MTFLLDTNACISYLNGRTSRVCDRLRQMSPDDVAVCSVVKAELHYGAMKSREPARTLAMQREFLSAFKSLPFDDRAAECYASIRARLESQGTPIGPNDLLIASISMVNDLILVTANCREFTRVEGLRFEDWESSM